VTTTAGAGLSRVTIVAPTTRIDLSLPSDIPLADLLPVLLRYASESGSSLADDPNARNGWSLSRLGGIVLDSARSLAQLEIRDGEMLYLRPRGAEPPELAFDDVVDAVATATQSRAGRWQPATSRLFGLILAVGALLGGAVAVLFSGPPNGPGGLVGLAMAVVLLVVATVLSRAFAQSSIAVIFGLIAQVYAAIGGLLLLAGDLGLTELGAGHVLIAAAALLVTGVVAAVAIADAGPLFLSTAVAALALLVGSFICLAFDTTAATGAAIVVAVTFAWLPALPMLAYRMARLPIPSIPTGGEDLKTDRETVDGQRVLARSERADEFLAAMLGAFAVIGAVAGMVTAFHGGPGTALGAVLGLLMMIRAKWFLSRRQRLPLLIAGVATMAVTIAAIYLTGSAITRLIAIPTLLLTVAGISISFGLSAANRKPSPIAGRILDIFEVLLIVAIVPLAVWVSGLYGWVRSLRG
jgi:type VII secretion integral membrane protein EccD